MIPGITEYLFTAVLFYNIGHKIGYWQHSSEHHKKPTKQIVIDDSTKVVNIYVDKRGKYWSDPHFTMGYSWGGYDSLITFPPLSKRKFKSQLKGNLIRVYCGLEDSEDQIKDIITGLKTLK